MSKPTNRKAPGTAAILAVLALALAGGCALERQIGIDEVLTALTAADRKIDNYCSRERSFTFDRDGRQKTGETRSIHYYAKPDESLLCVFAASAPFDIYHETGNIVRSRKGGSSSQQILPDSFFLRDWRSMIRLRESSTPPRFEFASGDPRKSQRRDDGIYEIRVTQPGHESALLRVDVLRGVILEKSVYRLPGGALSAREVHSDFVPLAGTYLPGKTIYDYGEETVVIHWSDYRVNVPVSLRPDDSTCERLAALTTGDM